MSLHSRRESKVFFTFKEGTSGVPSTSCFFEGRGTMTFPEPEYKFESDQGKLGSLEHGTLAELQAIATPFSYKTSGRLSEVLYFLSFLGLTDTVYTKSGYYQHDMRLYDVTTRTLPTFTIEYGTGGTSNNTVFSGCVVNEISLTLQKGGTGVIDCTVNGFGNRHRWASNVLAENAAGNLSTGTVTITTEPLFNFSSCKIWIGTSPNGGLLSPSGSLIADNLAGETEISKLVQSVKITINNGMNADDLIRASGYGVINLWERGDRSITLEMDLYKDTSIVSIDPILVANTNKSIEIQYNGKYITGSTPYALDMLFTKCQILGAPENDDTPIAKSLKFEVHQDTTYILPLLIFAQTAVSTAYNA
jgi:hypothetical protein